MEDVRYLGQGFRQGKRLGLMIRSENAGSLYDASFMSTLFEQEGGGLFDVRQAILGHIQQGGSPSPFDRIQATRLAARGIDFLIQEAAAASPAAAAIGLKAGQVEYTSLYDFSRLVDPGFQRPKEQWWLRLRPIAGAMAQVKNDEGRTTDDE
jgi:6-phosphofructokinase 1